MKHIKHKKRRIRENRESKESYLEKLIRNSGINIKKKIIIKVANIISIIASLIAIIIAMLTEIIIRGIKVNILLLTPLIILISFASVYIILILVLQIISTKRTKDIENSLANFLELASNNISAGMSIDKALWFAVRPNFGILSKEIEIVAKKVMNGYDLPTALQEFSDKYDSPVLKRSMLLLIEGLNAGGEVGDLLNKIAENITQTKILKKQISASVTTYKIFILFASIIIAPALFALGEQIIKIMSKIMTKVSMPESGQSAIPLHLSTSRTLTSASDFKIFVLVSLTISSFFTALIISNMGKGDSSDTIKLFPAYLIISYLIYFGSEIVLAITFKSFF